MVPKINRQKLVSGKLRLGGQGPQQKAESAFNEAKQWFFHNLTPSRRSLFFHKSQVGILCWKISANSNGRHFLLGYQNWTYNLLLESSSSLVSMAANLALMQSFYQKLWSKEWVCIKFHFKTFAFWTLFNSFANFHCITSSNEK